MESSLFADFSSLSSPLEQVFGHVPKGHDKALRQAIYNVLVAALFCVLAWAVYYVVLVVLEPFLVPLFWAVLTGFVIHPYKANFTEFLRRWLDSLNNEERPAFISTFKDFFHLLDWSCESVGSKIFSKWKLMIALTISLPIYHYVTFYPLDVTTPSIVLKLWNVFDMVEFITWPIVAASTIAYITSVLILWNENRRGVFQFFGSLLWIMIGLLVVNLFWPPLWMLSMLGMIFYASIKLSKLLGEDKDETDNDDDSQKKSKRMRFRQAVLTVLNRINSTHHLLDVTDKGQPSAASTPAPASLSTNPAADRIEKIQHPGVSALKKTHQRFGTPISDTPLSRTRPYVSRLYDRTAILKRSSNIELGTSQETSSYIKTVLWACICIQLFIHPSLLHLLPVPIAYTLFKKGWRSIGQQSFMTDFFSQKTEMMKEFLEERKDAILPRPVEWLLQEVYKIEREILKVIPKFLDTIVTCLMIFGMIVGVVLIVVFVSAQMYSETLYMVQTSGKLVTSVTNSSLFQQMNESLGVHQAYFKGMEDLVDSGYKYGREYISSSVVSIFKTEGNQESVDEFEKKLLELWDRIYQYWLTKNDYTSSESVIHPGPVFGPKVSQEALASSMEEVIHRVLAILDLSAFSQFTMNNMGTLISILDQGWSLLKGNLGFALTVISEIMRMIFNGGSGMVNFLLSVIVYFTALFYLLSLSSKDYKPVEVISTYSCMFIGPKFPIALNKAINSVFTVTFKMATFYSLWTYLTHTVFGASVITLPVLVSTFLATVPVAGQYLVALPAILELWLLKERAVSALALLFCHILPSCVVDAAFYSEVKQGIHPWITGLSIVGGVYYFGICGAIYGPLFLCGMYVILSVYMEWLQDIPLPETTGPTLQGGPSHKNKTPVIKRSESVHY